MGTRLVYGYVPRGPRLFCVAGLRCALGQGPRMSLLPPRLGCVHDGYALAACALLGIALTAAHKGHVLEIDKLLPRAVLSCCLVQTDHGALSMLPRLRCGEQQAWLVPGNNNNEYVYVR